MESVKLVNRSIDEIPIGAKATFTKTISDFDIATFGGILCSWHPIHMDDEWTRANTQFPNRIAHGLLTGALVSNPNWRLMDELGLPRTALLSTTSKYIRPVSIGDTITITVEVAEKFPEKKRIRMATVATNQRGEVVMVGEIMEHVL